MVLPGPQVQEAAADGLPGEPRAPHHEDPAGHQAPGGEDGGPGGEGRHHQGLGDEGGLSQ